MKILLVDDSRTLTTILSDFLKMNDYDCTTVNDGRNAMALMSQKKFDAVLLDLEMPQMNGDEIIEKLAKNGKINEQKIILFTASSVSDERMEEYLKKGVHSCIKKPVQTDVLLKILEEN